MNEPETNGAIPAADAGPVTPDTASEESSDWRYRGVHPMIRKAMEKHRREWEGLMKRYKHQWVIYHGDARLEIGKSREKLYRKYVERGFKWEELLVLGVRPPPEDEYDR
jgi:hypothetical protein